MSTAWPNAWEFNPSSVLAFNILELIGAIGMLVLFLFAALIPSIRRNATWFSFCMSWMISGLSFCLLLLFGQFGKRPPSESLCWVQSALIYAAPPLTACTTCALLVPLWYNLRGKTDDGGAIPKDTMIGLLVIPYCVWAGFIVLNFSINISDPSLVKLNNRSTYCTTYHPALPLITPIFVVLVAMAVLALEVDMGIRLYRSHKRGSQKASQISSFARVLAFGLLCLAALGFGLIFAIQSLPGVEYDIAMACLPLIGVIMFGSQKDLLAVCTGGMRKTKYNKLGLQDTN